MLGPLPPVPGPVPLPPMPDTLPPVPVWFPEESLGAVLQAAATNAQHALVIHVRERFMACLEVSNPAAAFFSTKDDTRGIARAMSERPQFRRRMLEQGQIYAHLEGEDVPDCRCTRSGLGRAIKRWPCAKNCLLRRTDSALALLFERRAASNLVTFEDRGARQTQGQVPRGQRGAPAGSVLVERGARASFASAPRMRSLRAPSSSLSQRLLRRRSRLS